MKLKKKSKLINLISQVFLAWTFFNLCVYFFMLSKNEKKNQYALLLKEFIVFWDHILVFYSQDLKKNVTLVRLEKCKTLMSGLD